ncbi:glycosyltransferase family 4 protein [Alphaproteobacteria bacterium KMM 3653]|uniref:Glycosyltransferase family 4 protein n=1 Tax=Harenicola maris TaxID=2841044 RepID=A0AAP2CMC5_9RHOB|nr:glycosyltransferase family 4 protein [Harenicola maris]
MPKICLLTHFMAPDDVISARLFDALGQDLAKVGWQVEARPSARSCHQRGARFQRRERRGAVEITRVWRPDFSQHRFLGRLLNSLWMLIAWTGIVFRSADKRPDVVVIGSDPVFAALLAYPLRFFRPDIELVHWAFDLHPEASVASGMLRESHPLVRLVRRAMGGAYRRFDLIFDLGACMRRRLAGHQPAARMVEAPPWAQDEPELPAGADSAMRRELFGQATLGLLYSGTFGNAHPVEPIVDLVRALRGTDVHFAFAVRGARAQELRARFGAEDTNVTFAGFASAEDLPKRLAAADIHLACLEPAYAGIAVPSKVLGSWAAGRPVLFAGPKDSAVTEWIKDYDLGWHMDSDSAEGAAQALRALCEDMQAVGEAQARAFSGYHAHFSRAATFLRMDEALRAVVAQRAQPQGEAKPARMRQAD